MHIQDIVKPTDSVIHFAPEPMVTAILTNISSDYRCADLYRSDVDLQLNIEEISLPSESVDVVVALHVMEHVDDSSALADLHRILRPGGRLLLMVPIVEGWEQTHEDDSVVSEDGRALHFGQFDHVRYYGRDLRDRLRQLGFTVDEYQGTPEEVAKHGLVRGETVFVAHKATA